MSLMPQTSISGDRRGSAPATAVCLFVCALGLLAGVRPAAACSICRCGDPTFNSLGSDIYDAGRFRLALDWERFDKDQGAADARESVLENRVTTAMSYTFSDRFTAVARVPYSSRSLHSTGGGDAATGAASLRVADVGASSLDTSSDLADPELYGLVRLWQSSFAGGLGRRSWISAMGGVKTPWGRNDLRQGGVRLDEHLQPGTGSTDYFAGFSGYYLVDHYSSLFGSVQMRWMGRNDFDYRYGDQRMANFGYEHKMGQAWDGVVEVNFRDAARDAVGPLRELDPDTGGRVLYLSPRLIRDFGRGVVGRLAVQVPVVKDLNGAQREKTVVNVGLTYLF